MLTFFSDICDSVFFFLFFFWFFFQLNPGYEIHQGDPGLQRYLYENYEACPESLEGGKGAFIVGKTVTLSDVFSAFNKYRFRTRSSSILTLCIWTDRPKQIAQSAASDQGLHCVTQSRNSILELLA